MRKGYKNMVRRQQLRFAAMVADAVVLGVLVGAFMAAMAMLSPF